MKAVLLLLLFISASVQADECLSYSGKVTLKGMLSKQTFAEQPNYESIERGDAAATHFFISPAKLFCVAEGADKEGLELLEPKVERVQLVFAGEAKTIYDSLRSHLGKEVVCVGVLFHEISGHHHSPILLGEAKCSAAQQMH